MERKVSLKNIYRPSDDVVARDVQGEFIIVPITGDIGGGHDEIFSLNETGRAIWERLNGKSTVQEVARSLCSEFDGGAAKIEADVLGLIKALATRRMVVEVK